jgi:hypothetical protein
MTWAFDIIKKRNHCLQAGPGRNISHSTYLIDRTVLKRLFYFIKPLTGAAFSREKPLECLCHPPM